MVIDAHIHLWNKVAGRLGIQRVSPVANGVIRIGSKEYQGMPSWFKDCRSSAELAIAAFDDAGVDAAVVTQEYLDGNQNECLLKAQEKYPGRFFVHGLIDFREPKRLRNEFAFVHKKGFRGIKCPAMFLPQLGVRLDIPDLMYVWEQMEAEGMVLSIDLMPGDVQVGQMKNIVRNFKKLKIAIGHFGMAGHGDWMSQIRLAEFENVYIECGGIIWLFRQEGPPFKQAQSKIRQATKAVGAQKLLWGSDYPRTMVDFTYRQSLELAVKGCDFMNKNEKKAFLGGNAARIYGFKYRHKDCSPRVRITEL
ncbi:MAG: amidohydrolase [Planctomycetaceae bacterium]|nr:amidohydrolase [Planctomycetaceae bacterium]